MTQAQTVALVQANSTFVSIAFERTTYTTSLVFISASGRRHAVPMPISDRGYPLSDGFEWGYSGQGPYATAIALLALRFHAIHVRPGTEEYLVNHVGVSPAAIRRVVHFVSQIPREGYILDREVLIAALDAAVTDDPIPH